MKRARHGAVAAGRADHGGREAPEVGQHGEDGRQAADAGPHFQECFGDDARGVGPAVLDQALDLALQAEADQRLVLVCSRFHALPFRGWRGKTLGGAD